MACERKCWLFFPALKSFHSVCGKQQRLKFNAVVEFTNTFKSQTVLKPWTASGGWAASYSLLPGVSPRMEFLDASDVHSPSPGPLGRNGATAVSSSWSAMGWAWGVGIVRLLFPRGRETVCLRQGKGLPGDPWWLCHSAVNHLRAHEMLCTSISDWKYRRRKLPFPFLALKSVYNIDQGSALVYETSTDWRSNLKPKNW